MSSICLVIHFGFLMNDARREVELITSCIYIFWLIIYDLGWVWKLQIIALSTTFYLIFVSSICLVIQFWVFDGWLRGGTNHLVYLLILAHSLWYWVRLKAINYSFKDNLLSHFCVQYLPCNSISGFWWMMQEGRWTLRLFTYSGSFFMILDASESYKL